MNAILHSARQNRELPARERQALPWGALTLTVATNKAASAFSTNELHDIKPPVEIPPGWLWLLWVGAGLLLVALGWLAWRFWKRRQAFVPPVPVIPPHIRAKQQLEEALALLNQPREFCTRVSDTIRWYLEERFDFRAPERTTEEFLYELQSTNLLLPDQKTSLGEFLQRCDLVKFAKYEPREAELRDLHASALRLVEETEPAPVADQAGTGATPASPAAP